MASVDAHQRFRAALDRAGFQMDTGDPAWEATLAHARDLGAGLGDEYRAEVRVRLHLLDHHVAVRDGDLPRAHRHLAEALDLLADHPDNAAMRFRLLDEQARTSLLEGDLPRLEELLRRLHAQPWDHPMREVMLRNREGDLALHRHDYRTAHDAYREAVAAARPHPELRSLLGSSLVSLATVAVFAGDADTAERTAARARSVVDTNVNDLAALHEVDIGVARLRGDLAALRAHYVRYQEFLSGAGAFAHPGQHREAAAGPALEALAGGEASRAVSLYRELAGRQTTAGDRALGLLRAAHAAWVAGDMSTAWQLLDDARDLLRGSDYLTLRASVEVYRALWWAALPELSVPGVRALLPQVQAAAIVLRHLSFQVDSAPGRQEFARYWANEAIEVSCHLAFEIGDNEGVAGMVELVAASPALTVAGPSVLVGAPPRTPGLDAAHRIASEEYGITPVRLQ